MLKSILKEFIPEELFDRPKQGFSVPIASWLRGPLKEWADSILSEDIIKKQGFFKVNKVRQLWDEHKNKKYDHSSKLWIILMWQSWLLKKNF